MTKKNNDMANFSQDKQHNMARQDETSLRHASVLGTVALFGTIFAIGAAALREADKRDAEAGK